MFERFTERARQVIVHAQDEAHALKHSYIGTEHLLLGLLDEKEGLAAKVLEGCGVTADAVRERIRDVIGEGNDGEGAGRQPMVPRAKRVLELALREALSFGQNYIGTEHILLGLVRENEGAAARVLLDFDADSEKIRNEVIRLLSGGSQNGRELDGRWLVVSRAELVGTGGGVRAVCVKANDARDAVRKADLTPSGAVVVLNLAEAPSFRTTLIVEAA